MSPELQSALIGAGVAILGAFAAIAAFLPPIIKRQMKINQDAQELRLASEKDARQEADKQAKSERQAAEDQRKQFDRFIDTAIESIKNGQQLQEETVKALTHQLEYTVRMMESQEASNKELRANTNITTEGVQAIGDLADNVKGLSDKVDGMDKQLVTIMSYRAEDKEDLGRHETLLKQIITHLNVLLKEAEGRLQDVRNGTSENPIVSPA